MKPQEPQQLERPLPPIAPLKTNLLRRVLRWKWFAIVVVATVVTLFEGYPWLSIQEGALLDPSNPYSEMFTVSNGGYVPVTDLDASCVVNYESPHTRFSNSGAHFGDFARFLGHGDTATIPCFMTVEASQVPAGARFDVHIGYAFYHLNYNRLRRHQSFHFQSIIGKDGSHHWIFLAP